MTLYSAALGLAITQTCYATGENHEWAVLKQLLGELDLGGVLIQADALPGLIQSVSQEPLPRLRALDWLGGIDSIQCSKPTLLQLIST